MLRGQQRRQIVEISLNQVQELHQHPGAALRVGRRPGRKGRLGDCDRLLDHGALGKSHLGLNLTGIGIEHLAVAARRRVHELSADEMTNLAHRILPVTPRQAAPRGGMNIGSNQSDSAETGPRKAASATVIIEEFPHGASDPAGPRRGTPWDPDNRQSGRAVAARRACPRDAARSATRGCPQPGTNAPADRADARSPPLSCGCYSSFFQ